MKIKDIVNRSNVNLQNCDQEPIHIPGSIQPHGFLLALDKQLQIKFCSANVADFLGATHEQLLGRNIKELTEDDIFQKLEKVMEEPEGRVSNLTFSLLNHTYEFITHYNGKYLLLEGERDSVQTSNNDLLELSKDLVRSMEETKTLKELCNLVAVSIRKVTGYDRVMVYRFDEQYNGEVFAESREEKLESFYGLHYPHTDIPAQARALYIRNQLRIITDVNYKPVSIFTIGDAENNDLDLSLSVLRSVSSIHIEYLHNMGVGATLTISLMLRGKLWGLIACHHYSEKYLSYDARMAAKLLGHFITSQIDSRILNEEYETAEKANKAVSFLSARKTRFDRPALNGLFQESAMLEVCNANGVSLLLQDTLYKNGKCPDDEVIKKLAAFLREQHPSSFHTDSLQKTLPGWKQGIGELPGINYFRLTGDNDNCIIWYRQESTREVSWAGDPAKAIEKDKNGLSPRKSFALWNETVKHHSKPWLASELNASANFVTVLEKHIHSIVLTEEEEKQRDMTLRLQKTNAELENINWISTHDLQEPLRKIQMIASLLLENEKEHFSQEVHEKIGKMNTSAAKMQSLIKDILKYTRLNYSAEALVTTDLAVLLKEQKSEWSHNLEEKQVLLELGELPVVKGIPFLIKQLFFNLISNSLKFLDPNRPGRITIKLAKEVPVIPVDMSGPLSDYHVIEFRDNGIGFGPEHNETVFKIFMRLHSGEEYVGSGVGLALCRKIMSTNNGYITAEGEEGKGVLFRLYFLKAGA